MNGAYYPNANYQGDMNLNNAPIGNDVDNEQSVYLTLLSKISFSVV